MISHFVILLLMITNAGCVLHTPHTVKFSSKNLMTFLTWEPATGNSSETLYQVEYKLYGVSRWIQKKECWNISLVQCDLTKDITHKGHLMCGRVRAVSHSTESDWVEAKMSIPHMDMTFDPPRFHLVPEANSMQVHIYPSFENYTDVEKMEYMIHYKQRNGLTLSSRTTALHTDRMEDLVPGTEYCVSVSSKIWMSHSQYTHHDYESAEGEACAFTDNSASLPGRSTGDQRHLQLVKRLSVGLLIPLLLISALLLLTRAFRSIYRPPAHLPLNLIFTVEEWKTLQKKAYVDMKQYDDDAADRNTRSWVQSKAKTNLYIKLQQRTLVSEQPIVNPSDEPLMGFSTPPPLLEGVRHVQAYAPQLSSPAAQSDESYGVVHHGPGLIDMHDFSSSDPKTDSMLASSPEPVYTNSEHPEPVYTNSEHPKPVYTNLEHPEPVYINSEHPEPVYTNSEHPEPVYTNSEHPEPVYTNSEHPEPVYINSEHPEPVYTNSEHPEPVYTNSEHPEPVYTNAEHPEPVYTNSEHPEPVYTNLEHPEPVYTNSEHPVPVYTNSENPKSVYMNSEQHKLVHANSTHPNLVYSNSAHLKPVYANSEHPESVYTNYKCSEQVYTNFEHPKPVDTNSEPPSPRNASL
ncbi:uncharacterized protein LOC118222884 isoform X1 [Anguilla anguilla]|uniref:uncharacterized protein LOC118222884 isoform X1 n=1 Tax=Anguilla anguilla TaxID=7936 RepID=UPI0015AE4BCE|nr:uncharacterized protein LOC118222884 isoform X1 [Anguilla anguilla]